MEREGSVVAEAREAKEEENLKSINSSPAKSIVLSPAKFIKNQKDERILKGLVQWLSISG